jgi:hypothetical protein
LGNVDHDLDAFLTPGGHLLPPSFLTRRYLQIEPGWPRATPGHAEEEETMGYEHWLALIGTMVCLLLLAHNVIRGERY